MLPRVNKTAFLVQPIALSCVSVRVSSEHSNAQSSFYKLSYFYQICNDQGDGMHTLSNVGILPI